MAGGVVIKNEHVGVRRVRQRLRDLGFTRKIPYNMDETTLQRWYGPGTGRYYE